MKKFIVFILAIAIVLASGCDAVLEALEEYETEQTQQETLKTDEPSSNNSNNSYTNELYKDMPVLPDLDFNNLDLFDDGYAVAEFDRAPDGDTAIFYVDGSYLKTRFLGVDTTEMSTDSGIPEDWAQEATDFTNDMLYNADEIILELDDNADAFDDYDRLLAWIWVDGQLLNYMLAARGFADVKYLYDDYKYNDYLLDVEYLAQNLNIGIWGDDEPYYNLDENYSTTSNSSGSASTSANAEYITIEEARSLNEGTTVTIKGVVTNMIDTNAFIEDGTAGIYLFTKGRSYSALSVGNEIIIEGVITDYNGFLEITDFDDNDIKIVSQTDSVAPNDVNLSQIGESLEGQYIRVSNAKITFVDYTSGQDGYSIFIEKNGETGEIRVDKYLQSYPDPTSLNVGDTINVVGNISQHYDVYQIMISDENAITYP